MHINKAVEHGKLNAQPLPGGLAGGPGRPARGAKTIIYVNQFYCTSFLCKLRQSYNKRK